MNKIIAIFMVITGITSPVFDVFASAGTITFTGNVLDSACEVTVASQNQAVVMGDYYKKEFPAAGSKTAATKFDIVLKNCPTTIKNAKVRFDGKPDATNSNLLAINTSTAGAATGIAINLMAADKTDLPLHGSNNYTYVLSGTTDNTLSFYAQYISTVDAVVSCKANSSANFSIVYN
ncbi:fimbrial protein [Enterobacter sp. RHBSTW-00994]|nr:fimbrial protein [Enterobacter sp. RHBSTW-00994]